MSRYFQTLKRLQSRESSPLPDSAAQVDVEKKPSAEGLYVFPEIELKSAKVEAAFAGLLDGLRLLAQTDPSDCVVIAGVSSAHAPNHVLQGVVNVAKQRAIDLVTGEFATAGGSRSLTLKAVSSRSTNPSGTPTPRQLHGGSDSLDLNSADLPGALQARVERVNPEADFTVLHGPPLVDSVDGALLGRATSGIVLVVEPLVTPRKDLFVALNRVERAGCTVLGFVAFGAQQWLPRWLQRLLDGMTR